MGVVCHLKAQTSVQSLLCWLERGILMDVKALVSVWGMSTAEAQMRSKSTPGRELRRSFVARSKN